MLLRPLRRIDRSIDCLNDRPTSHDVVTVDDEVPNVAAWLIFTDHPV